MDIKEAMATFQLKATKIVNLDIKNDFLDLPSDDQLDKSISLGNTLIEILNSNSDNDPLLARMQLQVNLFFESKIDNKKMEIVITVEGVFSFSENDENKFKQMLVLNGNSSLYSILRAYISTISSLTFDTGKITLPMINFLKLSELIQKRNSENATIEE